MFLSTLGLKRAMVHGWIKKRSESLFGMPSTKSLHKKKNQLSAWTVGQHNRKKHLMSYLNNLGKMESHFCRKDTRKLYLTSNFLTKIELYHDYQHKCRDDKCQGVSYFTFSIAFDTSSLALFSPRKDLCDLCVSYSVNQISKP